MDPSTESLIWIVVLVIGGILFFVGHIIKEIFSPPADGRKDGDRKSPKGEKECR